MRVGVLRRCSLREARYGVSQSGVTIQATHLRDDIFLAELLWEGNLLLHDYYTSHILLSKRSILTLKMPDHLFNRYTPQ